jgi:hypothetical protein
MGIWGYGGDMGMDFLNLRNRFFFEQNDRKDRKEFEYPLS